MTQLKMKAFVFAAVAGLASLYAIPTRADQGDAHHEYFVKCAKACADCQVSCE